MGRANDVYRLMLDAHRLQQTNLEILGKLLDAGIVSDTSAELLLAKDKEIERLANIIWAKDNEIAQLQDRVIKLDPRTRQPSDVESIVDATLDLDSMMFGSTEEKIAAEFAPDAPAADLSLASGTRKRVDYSAQEWAMSPHFLAYMKNEPFASWSVAEQNEARDRFIEKFKDAPRQNRWGKTFSRFVGVA